MRVGIIGAGVMGTVHAEGWIQTEASIEGIYDKNKAQADKLAQQVNTECFTDLASMLNRVDVVDICVPTHLHHPLVMEIAPTGVNIICEKPLARTLEQGRDMINICRENQVRLIPAHVLRFFPEYTTAREAVLKGEIGNLAVLKFSRESFCPEKKMENWYLDYEKSGGIILDLMLHDIDFARWMAGEVKSVYAKSIRKENPGVAFDHALVILEHENGVISHIEGSWAYPPPEFHTRFEWAGTGGVIRFSSDDSTPVHLHKHQLPDEGRAEVATPSSPMHESPYLTELKAFTAALKDGAPLPVTTGDALAALQIALAAIESAGSGESVVIDPIKEEVI